MPDLMELVREIIGISETVIGIATEQITHHALDERRDRGRKLQIYFSPLIGQFS